MIFDLIISFREKQAAMLSSSLAEVERRKAWEERNVARQRQVCVFVCVCVCVCVCVLCVCVCVCECVCVCVCV